MIDEVRPCKTVVFLKIDVRPLLPTGEISGSIIKTTGNVILSYSGNEEECVNKLNEISAEVKKLCG